MGSAAWIWIRRPALVVKETSTGDLRTHGPVPEFSLTDQNGQSVTLNTLKGCVWIADFIFTHCGGQCPMMTAQMVRLQRALPPDIRLVSFSVDPARDTPEVLSRYAKAHGAEEGRWMFLTGSQEVLYRLSREGFRLALEETGGSAVEPIAHSIRLILMDRQGRIRSYYDGSDDQAVQRLIRDARTLRTADTAPVVEN